MAKLSAIAMRNTTFRKIVKTKQYECVGRSYTDVTEKESAETRQRKLKQRENGENNFGSQPVYKKNQKQSAAIEPDKPIERHFKW